MRNWSRLEALVPHAQAVAQHADSADITAPTARLMNQLGVLFQTQARYAEAETLYRRALAIDEKSFGRGHPNIAAYLNNLALLLIETNRHAEAEPLYRRALAIVEKSFGPEHLNARMVRDNLASLMRDTKPHPKVETI